MHYIAEVKSGLLLELPAQAEELQLKPGDKVEVRLLPPPELREARRENGSSETPGVQSKQKQLRGRGMLAGVLNSEEFMRRKQAQIELEDRTRRTPNAVTPAAFA